VKTSRIIPLVLVPLLFACAPRKPEVPATEVPATPLVQALEQRRQSFQSLKAVSSVQVFRRGRRLAFENVGILIKSSDKLRIEAYSPLGLPLIELVWDGNDVFIRRPGEPALRKSGSGLERVLGADVEPREFCALLAGNVPEIPAQADSRAFCGEEGCVLDIRQGEMLRRVRLSPAPGADVLPASYELYRAEALVFRARFEGMHAVSNHLFPAKVVMENPDRKAGLTVLYEEVEVNVPVDDGAFILSVREDADR
jgi:outer membrane lipoprotein-sorting protein